MGKKPKLTEQEGGFAHLVSVNGQQDGKRKAVYSQKKQDSLAARLRAGDRAAAAELVDIYYEQIYWFMRRLGHDRQVSEDLTQDSFLQAWQHIGQLRSGKALNGWLYRIAGNVSRLYWRRHKGREAVGIGKADVADSREADCHKVEYSEQLDELKNAVVKLSAKLRQAVVLHYMQHLSISEAAEAAGVAEGTFKSRLNRALRALRKQVASEKEGSE